MKINTINILFIAQVSMYADNSLDGFNMNNDLNTIGGADSNNLVGLPSSRSQGINVDTSLLESRF